MCGRFSLGTTIRIGQLFDLPNWPEKSPRYHITPSQEVAAVFRNWETADREARAPREWFIDPRAGPEAMPRPTAPVAATGLALVWAKAAARVSGSAVHPRGSLVRAQAPGRPRGPVSRH
jgi:putative SOS response-associated peptidase YedK